MGGSTIHELAGPRLAACVFSLVAGCTAPAPEPELEETPEVPSPPRLVARTVQTPLPRRDQAGPAYFLTERSIVAIVDGEWKVVHEAVEPLGVDLVAGADGRVYAFDSRELSVVDEDGLHSVVISPRAVVFAEVAIGPSGEIALFTLDHWSDSGAQLNSIGTRSG